MAGSGSIDETRTLPSFTGVEPTLTATGGLLVQVPINKDDKTNQGHLSHLLTKLAQEDGFGYLNHIVSREDVDFTAVKLAQEQWDYKEEGLTPAAAALISIALTVATNGAGAELAGLVSTSASGAMANTAFSSLVSQASVSLINNKGDVSKTLKDLGKSSTVKQLAQATITAGVAKGLDNYLSKAAAEAQKAGNGAAAATLNNKLTQGIIKGTADALTENLLNGTDLQTALKNNLTTQLIDTASAHVYTHGVKPLDNATKSELINNLSHKLAAALTGCLSAKAKDKSCEAGAVGAVVGEMVGDWMVNDYEVITPDGKNVLMLTDEDKQRIINTTKLTAGSIALLYDFNVDVAVGSAGEAVRWNATYINENNEVQKVILDGDKGIYKCDFQNGKCIDTPVKVGESMFEDAFISPDTGRFVGKVYIGESIDGYIYNLNDKAWSSGFYSKELYAYNSLPGNIYDIKSNYPGHEGKSYHAFLFEGKYVTLRESGNILAGMNAATLGVPFDEFQKASGALHIAGIPGLIRHKATGYTYGVYPRYGEIDYQYLRSKYGYQLGIKRIECNIINSSSPECKGK